MDCTQWIMASSRDGLVSGLAEIVVWRRKLWEYDYGEKLGNQNIDGDL